MIPHQRAQYLFHLVSVDLVVSLMQQRFSNGETKRIESCCLPYACVRCRVPFCYCFLFFFPFFSSFQIFLLLPFLFFSLCFFLLFSLFALAAFFALSFSPRKKQCQVYGEAVSGVRRSSVRCTEKQCQVYGAISLFSLSFFFLALQ